MGTIVVCGEALMDVFALADTTTGMTLEARLGGSPFNVAVGLARLGQPVAFHGAVSTDFLGERLVRALRSEGVDTAPVVRVGAPTTLSLVGLDAGGVPSYSFYGEGAADRQLVAADALRLPKDAHALHVGSFALVVEPTASTLLALVEREHGRMIVSYDPNVRLNVEPDRARWREAFDWMLGRAHLIKVSEEDLALLCPDLDPGGFCARALSSTARLVVVTRGALGAIAATASTQVAVPALPWPVVDTVGAGDTFQAALLTWLAEKGALSIQAMSAMSRDHLESMLRFAGTAASLTCSRRGADPPSRRELASAIDQLLSLS